ncbi:MAG: zinc ribbon domain-containing protein, partial [Firmicutes bacterium]|nr:zinc ribbon domain-containing protein [Bacillota bacterium]
FCGEKLLQPLECSSCGNVLKPGARFCAVCGTAAGSDSSEEKAVPETLSCSSCGSVLKPDAKFCPKCGAKIEEPPAVEQEEAEEE